jgi:tRNA-Thr(GGU) m(6)t(6)A37 methyltransferase TsaA
MEITPLGYVKSVFGQKFTTPKQSQLHHQLSMIQLNSQIDWLATSGLEEMSHVWIIFSFHQNSEAKLKSPLVRPPVLGGNDKKGVFATRSSFRPNSLGLSLVRLKHLEPSNHSLVVEGLDCVDGTPVYDIKPYHPYADRPQGEVQTGWIDKVYRPQVLPVSFVQELEELLEQDFKEMIEDILRFPAEPGHHDLIHNEREYHTLLNGREIRWENRDINGVITRLVTKVK